MATLTELQCYSCFLSALHNQACMVEGLVGSNSSVEGTWQPTKSLPKAHAGLWDHEKKFSGLSKAETKLFGLNAKGKKGSHSSTGQYHPCSEARWWNHHAVLYRDIFAPDDLPQCALDSELGWRFIFQQENDPKQSGKIRKEWLWDHSLNVLESPCQ